MLKKLYLLLLIAACCVSCAKLDDFSAENQIRSFVVSTHSPNEIILDDVKLKQDTIFIPIVYGRYEFPMTFKAEIKTSETIDKIIGIDFSQEQTFETIESNLKFYIVAQNGSTREYHLRPLEIPLNENNRLASDFKLISTDPDTLVVSTKLHTVSSDDTVKIYVIDQSFPTQIVPRFTIAEKATFDKIWLGNDESKAVDFNNGISSFDFADQTSTYGLCVVAESGLTKNWVIATQNVPSFVANEHTPQEAINSTSINARQSSAKTEASHLEVGELRIDNRKAEVKIVIQQPESQAQATRSAVRNGVKKERAAPITSPLSVKTHLDIPDWIDLVNMTRDTVLVFDGYQDSVVFHAIDPVSNVARRWRIVLSETKSETALVESFHYNYNARDCGSRLTGFWPSVDMDTSKVKIYPQEKEIVLTYLSYVNDVVYTNWGVTLKDIKIQISKDATCTMPEISWLSTGRNQAKTLLGQSRKFDVISEAGDTTVWSIRLQASGSKPDTTSMIEEMLIKRVVPTYTTFKEEAVTIDPLSKEILVNLENDAAAYPMQIFPEYRLSRYAHIVSQNGGAKPLVFANAKATQEVVVMSQDGADSNKSVYTVKLISSDQPAGADIETITPIRVEPIGFALQQSTASIDKENGILTFYASSDADTKFPLTLHYNNFTISEGATTTLPSLGKLTFNKADEDVIINIKAIDGTPRIWKARLEYRTQLTNWKLDQWDGNSPIASSYWASANNNFGTGTKPSVGVSGTEGDNCATLTTSNMMNKIAAGSLFLGWFDKDNILAGLQDPVVLTFFGVPYNATKQIKGITFDASYSPGVANEDWGSASIYLIDWDGKAPYVFHGNRPGATPQIKGNPHPKNTATMAGEASIKISTKGTTTKHGHAAVEVVDGEWKTGIELNIDGNVKFTHIAIVFSSSAYGDYFEGKEGSILRVDNIKLVYQD